MVNLSPHAPVVKRTYRLFFIPFLIFLLQIVLPLFAVNAEASPRYPRGYSVKALDFSGPITFEDLMAAGQLGGPLHPTHDLSHPAVNASFGEAMQAWNEHHYQEAVELFRLHIAQYPDSPWVAEAVLHIGCDSLYHGRYTEAQYAFESIIQANINSAHPGAQMLVHKARLRLANLKTAQGNLPAAMQLYTLLKQYSPDWRQRTYAAHWIQRLSREKHHYAAIFNCGTQALAFMLEKRGKKAAAAKVLALQASSPRGQSMKELQLVAAGYGYRLTGLRLSLAQLQKLPLPAIVQLSGVNQGDLGHYWVLEKRAKNTLHFYDPQSRRRFILNTAEFAREWQGHALVFAPRQQKLPGAILAAREMENLYGGCCGAAKPPNNQGKPKNPPGAPPGPPPSPPSTSPDPTPPKTPKPDDPDPDRCSNGSPVWSVNKVNMNFFVQDIPLWNNPPIGPAVEIALSYNSQSSLAVYEPFGHKWQFNYGTYLVENSGGEVLVFMPDGRQDEYLPDGLGGYTAPAGVYNTLAKIGDKHYEMSFPDDTVYVYDLPAGSQQVFLVEIRDAYGQKLSFSYDSNQYLTTITDAVGRVTNLTYNGSGQVTTVTDSFGRQAKFEYDAGGNLIKITDMGGYWSTFTYDQDKFITSIGNARGTWTFYTEPADGINNDIPNDSYYLGNPYPPPGTMDPARTMYENYRITVTNPLGFKEEYYYCGYDNGYGWYVCPMNYVDYVDIDHSNYKTPQTKYYYQTFAGKGMIKSTTLAAGGEIRYDYDTSGNLKTFNDGRGIWNYTYNSRGKVVSITNPNSKVMNLTYATNNVDLISSTDDLGTISLTYNNAHDITSITDRLGNTTTLAYNNYGQLISLRDALGFVNNYMYDSGHCLTTASRGMQPLHQFTYDALDRVQTHTGPTGLTLAYEYNELDQVTKVTYPDTKSKRYQYSTCCPFKIDSITERSARTTFFSYDQLSRLITITDPAGGATGFTYDPNGNRATITDPKGNTTQFTYDANNRLIQKTYADGNSDSFFYNTADGLPYKKVNARGITTNYSYNGFHQLTWNYDSGAPLAYYSYDNFGRMTGVVTDSPFRGYGYTYDANSRMVGISGAFLAGGITYQYDALGRRIGMTRNNGRSAAYSYDDLNRLTGVTVGGQVYTYGYNGVSPLVRSLTRPDGAVTTYDYDILNRLTQMTTRIWDTVICSYAYTYNDQDLRAGETAVEPASPRPYVSGLVNYEYNNANALTRITDPGEKLLAYDASGNLTNGYTPEGYAFTAVYDGSNRLTSLSYTDQGDVVNLTKFRYLGNMLFWKQTYRNGVLSAESRYFYDGALLTQERDQSDHVVREYTWGLGLPGGIGGLLDLYQGAVHFSYLYDGKGNVAGLLDPNGNIAATYQYDPFGMPRVPANSIQQPFQFSTKAYDEKTGLSYYGYRYYISSLGRWLTRDPIGEAGGMNLYRFAGNDTPNFVDPNGHGAISVTACAALTLAATASTIVDLHDLFKEINNLKNQRRDLHKKCNNPNLTGDQLQDLQDQINDIDKQINSKLFKGVAKAVVGQYALNPIIAAFCAASPYLPF